MARLQSLCSKAALPREAHDALVDSGYDDVDHLLMMSDDKEKLREGLCPFLSPDGFEALCALRLVDTALATFMGSGNKAM